MLRLLVALLLAANLAFLVWSNGWLEPWLGGPMAGQREPERLKLQVRPESVTVLSPRAASAAVAGDPPEVAGTASAASATPAAPPSGSASGAAPTRP